MIKKHGFRISDSSLLPLKKVLKSWIECTEEYISVWGGDDLPYWYNERANVSIFAGAAWRSGMTAIEEYQSNKLKKCGTESNGRNDLYLADLSVGIGIEAKVVFPDISNTIAIKYLIENRLVEARLDTNTLQEEGHKVSAVFIAPYSKTEKASNEQVQNFLSILPSLSVGAYAWCASNESQKAASVPFG